MKALKTITALLATISLLLPLAAQEKVDKIATVNMGRLLSSYYKNDQLRDSFKEYEEEITQDNEERAKAIKALVEEARNFQKQGDDPSLSGEKRNEFFKQAGLKNQEAQQLARARQEWIGRKRSALNEKANLETAILKKEILEMVRKLGEEQGYDFIFDRSGTSGAQVPILAYAKDATDLTAPLIEIINKDAPKKDGDEGAKPE